ncbi:hypothetical protein [Rufibacter latericius]|uniref:Uncharacterized protein n=1 Tax=Rufibacter latericius TaxID=2487040 RepID=A0A3M9MJY4_9BACT|nr:hypothetical protein [Rufibacter latericius]RNI25859.1 hypothetical protein EFB08_13515 [Rufibacter latericius]
MEESQRDAYFGFEELIETKGLDNVKGRRRDLLPWWIKAFTWIFLLMAAIVPIGVVMGLMGLSFSVSLYGFETTNPISPTGITLTLLIFLKGVTAFGLWTEKDWAVRIGTLDAVIGLVACGVAMFVLPFVDRSEGFVFNFRLEPILLVLYLLKLLKIKPYWEVK